MFYTVDPTSNTCAGVRTCLHISSGPLGEIKSRSCGGPSQKTWERFVSDKGTKFQCLALLWNRQCLQQKEFTKTYGVFDYAMEINCIRSSLCSRDHVAGTVCPLCDGLGQHDETVSRLARKPVALTAPTSKHANKKYLGPVALQNAVVTQQEVIVQLTKQTNRQARESTKLKAMIEEMKSKEDGEGMELVNMVKAATEKGECANLQTRTK